MACRANVANSERPSARAASRNGRPLRSTRAERVARPKPHQPVIVSAAANAWSPERMSKAKIHRTANRSVGNAANASTSTETRRSIHRPANHPATAPSATPMIRRAASTTNASVNVACAPYITVTQRSRPWRSEPSGYPNVPGSNGAGMDRVPSCTNARSFNGLTSVKNGAPKPMTSHAMISASPAMSCQLSARLTPSFRSRAERSAPRARRARSGRSRS